MTETTIRTLEEIRDSIAKALEHAMEGIAALQARLDEFDKILDPVRQWYDQEGKETDTAKMLRLAIADLQEDRAELIRFGKEGGAA